MFSSEDESRVISKHCECFWLWLLKIWSSAAAVFVLNSGTKFPVQEQSGVFVSYLEFLSFVLLYTTYFTHRVPTILTEHRTYVPGCSSLHGYGTQKCIRRRWQITMFLNKQNASSLRMFILPALKSNITHYTSSISVKYFKNCPSSLHKISRHIAEETSSIKVSYVKFLRQNQ